MRFGNLSVTSSPKKSSQSGWSARQPHKAKEKPDPVAMKIGETLAGFENDPRFNLGNHGYTLRRVKGKGASGFIVYKNEKAKEAFAPSSTIELDPPRQEGTAAMPGPEAP